MKCRSCNCDPSSVMQKGENDEDKVSNQPNHMLEDLATVYALKPACTQTLHKPFPWTPEG